MLALVLALVAAWQARDARQDRAHGLGPRGPADAAAIAALDGLPPDFGAPVPVPGRTLWIGAWCSPPARALRTAAYDSMSALAIDVAVAPLEDSYRRTDNLARLRLLAQRSFGRDAVDSAGPIRPRPVVTFVRDDSVHWDESTRPGWEGRIERAVAAYRGEPALAGYFLADEPRPEHLAAYAPVSRLLRRLDPEHPVYVNFAGLPPRADATTVKRWEADLERALREAELPFFTVDAYPFTARGERDNFLRTLEAAARVSRAVRRPWGVVLQVTGHGDLVPATGTMLRYQALQALAHGATSLTWFTYWTPNPEEAPWSWTQGAVDYAHGRATPAYAALASLAPEIGYTMWQLGGAPTLVRHVGAGLPEGWNPANPPVVPGLAELGGGPLTVAFTRERRAAEGGSRTYVLHNRDLGSTRQVTLRFAPEVRRASCTALQGNPSWTARRLSVDRPQSVDLPPAGGAILILHFD